MKIEYINQSLVTPDNLSSNHNLGMYYISTGLSAAQIAQFNTNVNTFMTALGRNV